MGKMRIFLDTNVVIDYIGEREPFYDSAATLFSLHQDRYVRLSLSALSVVNCAYILHKSLSTNETLERIKWLCDTFDITPIDKGIVIQAIKNVGSDFEDTVQYYSALSSRPDVIITRDKKGFASAEIPVMTPTEFLEKSRKQSES